MLSGIGHDLRFALRSFSKSPLLVGVATVSLALGIGANTAIFTLFDQVLLRLLPVKDPASLVIVTMQGNYQGSNHGQNAVSYPMYKDYRERNQVFDGILCRRGAVVNLGFGDGTERAEAELVSGTTSRSSLPPSTCSGSPPLAYPPLAAGGKAPPPQRFWFAS